MGAINVRNCTHIEHGLALFPSDGLNGRFQGLMLLSAFTATCGRYVRGLVVWTFLECYLIRGPCSRSLNGRRQFLVAMTGAVAYCLN